MGAIASSVMGLNTAQYPQPTGYHVYLSSSSGVVDDTTNIYINNVSDQYQGQYEVTSVTFLVMFKKFTPYEFNNLIFYTQVGGEDFMEVADFLLPSIVQKPANYVIVAFVTFSISTPVQFINPVQDVIQECEQYCKGVNCNSVASNICTSFIPFSLFNLVFLYLLGVTVKDLEISPNVQQQIEQYNDCMGNCVPACALGNPIGCTLCILGCLTLLLQDPIAIFTIGNKIPNLTQLLPRGINAVYAINVCSGKVATFQPQNVQTGLNVVSESEVQYIIKFSLPSTNNFFNALQFMVSTALTNVKCNNYSLGVIYFIGVPLPSGESFILTVTISETTGGQSNGG
jgi:hypothetical protein